MSTTRDSPHSAGPKPDNFYGVDLAEDYHGLVKALKGCQAVIHLAAIPDPLKTEDYVVRGLLEVYGAISY